MNLEAHIQTIAADNTSGATELAARACEVLSAAARETAAALAAHLWDVGKRLIAAQPAMAPIINVVNVALLAAEGASEGENHAAVTARMDRMRAVLCQRPAAIASAAWPLLPEGAAVLTHSSSSVVLRALLEAHGRGRCAEAYCTESRPMREGVALARRLAEEGLPVTLIADAAAAAVLPRVSAFAVGADAVTRDAVINKIGTFPIALAARRAGVPVYALCGSEKLLGSRCIRPDLHQPRAASELLQDPPPGVRVHNVYFEATPLDLFDAVVTESDVLSPASVPPLLDALPVHGYLMADP